MWLTASAWLPAALLDALEEPVHGDGDSGLEAAFSQGGPLDAMPPGPVLAAFLTEGSAPSGANTSAPRPATGPARPGSASPPEDRPLAGGSSPGDRPPDDPPAGGSSPGDRAPGDPPTGGSPLGDRPAGGSSAGGSPESLAARIASGSDLTQCGDNALLGLIRGWRRVASLAAAAELAAVSEFSRRRQEQAKADGAGDSAAVDAADAEIAAALTLTARGTQLLMDRADMMHELPATATALAAGRIDWPKALVLITGLNGQDPSLARRVEAEVIGRAPQQTTGQLRASLNRALLAADPEAAERRRQAEERHSRIERGPEPGGVTALLAGRCLPATGTVTAWDHITGLARQLRAAGAAGSLDELRVHVFLALLNGQPVTAPAAEAILAAGDQDTMTPDGEAEEQSPASTGAPAPASSGAAAPQSSADRSPCPRCGSAGVQSPGFRGQLNLTVPLSTVLGLSDGPGQLAGFGPITGHTARQLAVGALGQPAVRWCITVTGDQGQPVGHGCATRVRPTSAPPGGGVADAQAPPGDPGWTFTVKLTALAGSDCSHARESAHYRPPPSLRHLVQTRNTCCTAPGCRMPASACDDDHTTPFEYGGRTCECNVGPLCRHHHRVKQAQGWRLEQPEPGVFAWTTPSGRFYITGPTQHIA